MKSETRKIKSRRSLSQIQSALRTIPCTMEPHYDPLALEMPIISVLMYGRPKFFELFSHPGGADALWAVIVEVFDRSEFREITLTAIGTGYWGAGWNKYKTGQKSFVISFSKDYMNKIETLLI